jgi:hypothetical protein
MGVIKDTIEFYKQKKCFEKQKKMLVKKALTLGIFEEFIQRINDNPDLRMDVHFSDGTTIHVKTYHKVETHDLINGNIYEVQ